MCLEVIKSYSLSFRWGFSPQISVFKWFLAFYSRSFQSELFSKTKIKRGCHGERNAGCWRAGIAGCRKKTKNAAEQLGTGKDDEAKGGGQTSRAARKTTGRRDGGESHSSWTYQGSVQAKVPTGHQKPCRVVLIDY